MTTKRYIFPMGEIVAMVQEGLREYLNAVTDYCNHVSVIECTVNEIICEYKGLRAEHGFCFLVGDTPRWTIDQLTPTDIIVSYGIPTDVACDLSFRIKVAIERMFEFALGELIKDHDYHFSSNQFSDIELCDNGPERQLQRKDNVDEMINSIREGIDNGDWYPEHLRRVAGR